MPPTLALGGHQKTAVAVGGGERIVLGPHVGDLDGVATRAAFARAADAMSDAARPASRDRRLRRASRLPQHAARRDAAAMPVARVPHHLAHALACMVDNGLAPPVLAVAWDGTGYGGDGTIWGGEFLAIDGASLAPRRASAAVPPARRRGGGARAAPRRARRAACVRSATRRSRCRDLPPLAAFQPAERRAAADHAGARRQRAAHLQRRAAVRRGRGASRPVPARELRGRGGDGCSKPPPMRAATPLAPAVLAEAADGIVIDWRPTLRCRRRGARRRGRRPAAFTTRSPRPSSPSRGASASRACCSPAAASRMRVLTERTAERLRRGRLRAALAPPRAAQRRRPRGRPGRLRRATADRRRCA